MWEKDPGVKVSLRYLPNTTVTIYKLPGAGTVYHITHTDKAWADAIFEGYQQEAQRPLFERKPLKGVSAAFRASIRRIDAHVDGRPRFEASCWRSTLLSTLVLLTSTTSLR